MWVDYFQYIGQALERAARTVPDQPGPQYRQHANLEAALHQAAALAAAGDVVLLSPACASYDQFPHYEARGEYFCTLVQALPEATQLGDISQGSSPAAKESRDE